MGLGGELQPAAGGEIDRAGLGHHGGQRRGAKPFLDRPQQVLVGGGADRQQPTRVEPEAGQAMAVKRRLAKPAAAGHPQHRPGHPLDGAKPGQQGGTEPGRRRVEGMGGGDIMDDAAGEPAPRQMTVDGGDAEPDRRRPVATETTAFKPRNRRPQNGPRVGWGGQGQDVHLRHHTDLFTTNI